MIRKIVFGGKRNKVIDLESFKERMELYENLLICPSLIRQEYLFFMGRIKPEIFENDTINGLHGAITSFGSSVRSKNSVSNMSRRRD